MWLRFAVSSLALAASALAWGQAPEPERLLRLSYLEGDVGLQSGGRRVGASPDQALVTGDRVTTRDHSRAELLLDASPIRLDEDTVLHVDVLEATHVQLGLDQGVANVQVRDLYDGERFDFVMANVRVAVREPGEYRVEARSDELSVLTVVAGSADVATTGGLVRVAGGQRVLLEGRDSRATLVPPLAADAFDDWVLEREVQLASTEAPEGPNDAAYVHDGGWYDDATYGHVWMADTAYGSSPWVYFAFGSGRWAFLPGHGRWCWNPPRPSPGPVFARETHPFGRPRSSASRVSAASDPGAMAGVRQPASAWGHGASTHRWGFGSSSGSSGSSGSMSRGSTATMRPSGSWGRSHSSGSTSSGSHSVVFGVPTSH